MKTFKQSMYIANILEYRLVFSAESNVNAEDIVNEVTKYIESVQQQLELHPPSNVINKEKRQTLRNLYDSGYEEDVIADQLDLDVNTVRIIVEEISPK